jgi:hypothetical protein
MLYLRVQGNVNGGIINVDRTNIIILTSMRKLPQEITKLFLEHTPVYTREVVLQSIKAANLDAIQDDKKL